MKIGAFSYLVTEDNNVVVRCWNPLDNKENVVILPGECLPRFVEWWRGHVNIQDALPDIEPGIREILISGLTEDEFDDITST